jgi:hypothetical protein
MNRQDKKRLDSIMGNIRRSDEQINELLRKMKITAQARNGEVNENEEPQEVIEADVECLEDVSKSLSFAGQTLDEHFQLT